MTQAHSYSLGVKVAFWLLWTLGLLVFVLFAFFALITLDSGATGSNGWVLGVWNLLVVLAEGFILGMSARAFFRGAKSGSELVLWAALAVFGVPLAAFGGCALVGINLL